MLPRAARLRRSRDFQIVYGRRAQSWATPTLALSLRYRSAREGGPDAPPPFRVGLVISKKTAKRAHERNQIKRRLREICRLRLLPRLTGRPADLVFVARSAAVQAAFERLAADVETLARQAGVVTDR